MNTISTEQQAAAELQPYYDTVSDCINGGIQEYLTYDSPRAAIHCNRTKANLIRDYIVNKARIAFEGMEDTKIIEKSGLFVVLIKNKFAIRFKKLNKAKLSSNVATKQSLGYVYQHQLKFDFPDMQQTITNLDAGYISDTNYTFINGVNDNFLVCRNGKYLYWSLKLTSVGISNVVPLIEFADTSAEENLVIKVKTGTKQKKAGNE